MSQAIKQLGVYFGLLSVGGALGIVASQSLKDEAPQTTNPPMTQPIKLPDPQSRTPAPSLENSSFIAKAAQTVGPSFGCRPYCITGGTRTILSPFF